MKVKELKVIVNLLDDDTDVYISNHHQEVKPIVRASVGILNRHKKHKANASLALTLAEETL